MDVCSHKHARWDECFDVSGEAVFSRNTLYTFEDVACMGFCTFIYNDRFACAATLNEPELCWCPEHWKVIQGRRRIAEQYRKEQSTDVAKLERWREKHKQLRLDFRLKLSWPFNVNTQEEKERYIDSKVLEHIKMKKEKAQTFSKIFGSSSLTN